MTRHRKAWIGLGVTLVALVVIALIALPEIVRRVAASKIADATGRPGPIEKVELNLFTGPVISPARRTGWLIDARARIPRAGCAPYRCQRHS